MSKPVLFVFDPDITESSPAGSCLLKMLRAAAAHYNLQIFTTRTDLEPSPSLTIHRIPIPLKPVFLQSFLFTLVSVVFHRLIPKPGKGITISTQGGFPFCDISYAHCCHQLLLTRYRSHITGGFFTRAARLINHHWCAAMEARAFRHAALIVVPSNGLAKDLTSAYGPAIAAKLRIISNPVDCQSAAVATQSAKQFTFSFCALGNFEWKGLGLILNAMATGVPAYLQVIGGTSAEIHRFKNQARTLGLTSQVRFIGIQKNIRPYLENSHVFVFPSIHETFPLVCLQAAAAGLPLITTSLYGLEDLLRPGISGWRIERTVESLAAAMRLAVQDKERTAEMGRQSQRLAQQYNTPVFQEHWLKLLKPRLQ